MRNSTSTSKSQLQLSHPPMSCSLMITKNSSKKLESIDENGQLPLSSTATALPPETPTESMEFLARSWSLSAMELSKALSTSHLSSKVDIGQSAPALSSALEAGQQDANSMASRRESLKHLPDGVSPPISPRCSQEMKELFLLHQALNPDFIPHQQLLKNGQYKNIIRRQTMGRRLKDQKERKKQETRVQNAQLHAAISVAGVAAVVAAMAASNATPRGLAATRQKTPSDRSVAMASAAALVASHSIAMAEDMGAESDQVLTVVKSAINARTNGDIMTLTAAAATALRQATMLRARLQKGCITTAFALVDKNEDGKESDISTALNFVCVGGELLKQTRKGALHWKQVCFKISSNGQVVSKMKSKHMAGTFTKNKKCVVYGVCCDVLAWPGRGNSDRVYFGIKTSERIIEFECRNKGDKQMWVDGIQYLLNFRANASLI